MCKNGARWKWRRRKKKAIKFKKKKKEEGNPLKKKEEEDYIGCLILGKIRRLGNF